MEINTTFSGMLSPLDDKHNTNESLHFISPFEKKSIQISAEGKEEKKTKR